MLWVVLVILLAAASLMLIPAARLDAWTQALTSPKSAGTTPLPPGAAPDMPTLPGEPPVAAVDPIGPESTRRDGSMPAVPATPVTGQSAAPVGSAVTAASEPSVAASAAQPAPAAGAVSFSATAESWVRVTDSRGATVFEKVLQPGNAFSADGAAPLSVVVGNARATSVQVRGQAFDLSSITRNNVARFEVR